VRAVLIDRAPEIPVIELFSDAPAQDPRSAAYLLAGYFRELPRGTVFLCVVDPGVGGDRRPVIVQVEDRWFVGPDNGLFHAVCMRTPEVRCWEILWRPERLSMSFHGRDLFAPVAAGIATGVHPERRELSSRACRRAGWPDDLPAVIYVDHYGNAITGLRASAVPPRATLRVGDALLHQARTFTEVAAGQGFWYENSSGLVELAVNRGRADRVLHASVGTQITVV
jgi:S-adenosylmethionine hydrolase